MARRNHKSRGSRRRKVDRKKAIYVLPNLFTSASLFCGFFAMVASVSADFFAAALGILTSAVFDFLDGKVARATNTTSKFGMEYDSLSDLVAFGVAPGLMLYLWALQPLGRLGWLASFLFVACGALRLARFNVQAQSGGSKNFVGLPIPGAASMVATTVLLFHALGYKGQVDFWPVAGLVFVLSFLMVSNVPYLSLKEVGFTRLKSFNWLVAGVLFFILVAINPQVMGFVCLSLYVCLGPLGAYLMTKKRAAQEAETASDGKTASLSQGTTSVQR